MHSTPSQPSLPDWLRSQIVAPDLVLSMGQIKLFHVLTVYLCKTELFEIELFDYLTVCKTIQLCEQKTEVRLG